MVCSIVCCGVHKCEENIVPNCTLKMVNSCIFDKVLSQEKLFLPNLQICSYYVKEILYDRQYKGYLLYM